MRLADLSLDGLRFRSFAEVLPHLRAACEANPDVASFQTIGYSEEGRPLAGVTLGYGPHLVTLVAGHHADEPVGPETLRTLVLEALAARDWGAAGGGMADLFERVTFRIVPHANPDGEARNRPWIEAWDRQADAERLAAYLRQRRREAPGRDLEFGFPDLRPENRAVTAFLFDGEAIRLHASLHGMGFSEGALLLLDREHLGHPSTDRLRTAFAHAAEGIGLRLHDHDRGGDKGFVYGGPGFTSTPTGAAMRAHLEAAGDPETAARFLACSMELAAEWGTDALTGRRPLALVTELPLFVLDDPHRRPGVPEGLLRFREALPALTEAAEAGDDLAPEVERLGVRTVALPDAVRVHLATLDAALDATGAGREA